MFNYHCSTNQITLILIDQKPELPHPEMAGFFENLLGIGSNVVAVNQFVGPAKSFGGIGNRQDAVQIEDFLFNGLFAHEFFS